MNSTLEIERFPDPIPHTDEVSIERFKEGRDDKEKYLTSRLVDVTKQPHDLPFLPTGQTAKNVPKNVKCSECKKSGVIYAAKKSDEHAQLQKLLKNHIYICGTSFADINENPVVYVRETRIYICGTSFADFNENPVAYVRENHIYICGTSFADINEGKGKFVMLWKKSKFNKRGGGGGELIRYCRVIDLVRFLKKAALTFF